MVQRGLQVLAVAFDTGEADAGQLGRFGHGEVFFERFSHFAQVLGIESFRPADVLALRGGQLLASTLTAWANTRFPTKWKYSLMGCAAYESRWKRLRVILSPRCYKKTHCLLLPCPERCLARPGEESWFDDRCGRGFVASGASPHALPQVCAPPVNFTLPSAPLMALFHPAVNSRNVRPLGARNTLKYPAWGFPS